MMKRWIALLCVMLCFGGSAFAEEESAPIEVPIAAQAFDASAFDGRLSYTYDAATGAWSAGADAFEAVLDSAKRSSVSEMMLTQLKWTGNARTGIVQPLLEMHYFGPNEVMPNFVSFRVGNTRYDLAAMSEAAKVGTRDAERISIPLDEGGMALIDAMNDADRFSIRLHGKKVRSTIVTRGYTGNELRKRLESAAFLCIDDGAFDMNGYLLWDLNAASWKSVHKFEPQTQTATLTERNGFEMVSLGDSGTKVRALQRLLMDNWLLMGSADGAFNDRLCEAVVRAQKHYGLMQTGSADNRLIALLSEKAPPQQKQPPQPAALIALSDVSVRLNRCWFAQAVEPSSPIAAENSATRVGNMDNAFVIFDGEIKNDGLSALDLSWQVTATVYLDDYAYSAMLLCERDQGSAFETELLPQGASRLLLIAEVPMSARGAKSIRVEIDQNTHEAVFLTNLSEMAS